jgi:hypothetical protein
MTIVCRERPWQRNGSHLQAGNPPFGAILEHRDRCCIQVEAHDVVQELGCLVFGKAKIGGPELNRLAARSQTGQGKRWVRTGSDHQVEGRGAVIEQKSHLLVHGLAADKLIVVQDQGHLLADGIQAVDEAGQDHLRGCLARRRQELCGLAPDRMVSLLQGSDEVPQESPRPVVILIQRQPGDWCFTSRGT